jgi:cyanophycinase
MSALIPIAMLLGPDDVPAAPADPGYSYYEIGDVAARRPAPTEGALLLSGGGAWVPDAFHWFVAKAGHGHLVILSAYGGGEDGEEFFKKIGGLRSVQTLVFRDRKAASDPKVISILNQADAIFIAGGDQSKYVRFWKGTPVARTLDEHIRSGRPIGGTSAGLAILGASGYGAMDGGSIDSATALRDPAGPAVTIVSDFLHMPFLTHIITDAHFTARNRLGRLIAFVARVRTTRDPRAVGLGVDQEAALCVDSDGIGRLFTTRRGFAWLVQPESVTMAVLGRALDYPLVRLTGIGPHSAIDLKTMRVMNPAFTRFVSVRGGTLVDERGA